MSLKLNGQLLVLASKAPINHIKEKGLELEILDNVFLEVDNIIDTIVNKLKPKGSTPFINTILDFGF